MSTPTVTSVKVFAVVESVIQPPIDMEQLRQHLKQQKFRGEVHVNHSQGGLTNVVTREVISLTMQELDQLLKRRC